MIFFLSPELEEFRQKIRRFSETNLEKNAERWDENEEFPYDSLKALAEEGILSIGIPEQYGGSDPSKLKELIATEEIARVDPNTSIQMEIKSLYENTLLLFGSEGQKNTLKEIVTGKKIPAFAFTEPSGGTDISGIKSIAKKENDKYLITGSKNFITNALVADYFILFAKTSENFREKGFSAFFVKKNEKLKIGKKIRQTGIRGSAISSLHYENMPVDEKDMIGKEGQGVKIFSSVLERSRLILSAGSLGSMERLYEESLKFANNRKSLGAPLLNYQFIQYYLSEMLKDIEASRLLIYNAAMLMEKGLPFGLESTLAKLYVTEALVKNANNAVQIMGGYGYTKGTVVERLARDSHAATFGLGSSEAMRMLLTRYMKKN
ncbi:MAG: acyl-CoA dehydrogenase family protein [Thermoplasmata archaeon]|nr:acyl-CoA dehydrogenase family protein [Thermoplasmata archaeon]